MNEYPKLVRDKVPELMLAEGLKPVTRTLAPHELRIYALKKLVEESQEALAAFSNEERLVEEMGDVSEAFDLVIKVFTIAPSRITVSRMGKLKKKGGFTKHILLEGVRAK
jgi:predicted house-cleaning noncanonical NTP pyrophosphatase (MazG superfamily)